MRALTMWDRVAAVSGAVGVVLTGAGAVLGDPYRSGLDADPMDGSPLIAEALLKIREGARLGALLTLVGGFLLVWFVAYLRHHLRSYEGADGWMASVAYGGGLIAIALLLVSASFGFAATEIVDYGDETVIARVFLTHGWNYFYVISPPVMALVAASSVIGFRFRALPRWLSIPGFLMRIGPFSAGAGLGAMLGLLWMLLTSVALALGYGQESTRASHTATTS